MKRIIEITEETDKLLVSICDQALKNGGFAVHSIVSQLINSIKIIQDDTGDPRAKDPFIK